MKPKTIFVEQLKDLLTIVFSPQINRSFISVLKNACFSFSNYIITSSTVQFNNKKTNNLHNNQTYTADFLLYVVEISILGSGYNQSRKEPWGR